MIEARAIFHARSSSHEIERSSRSPSARSWAKTSSVRYTLCFTLSSLGFFVAAIRRPYTVPLVYKKAMRIAHVTDPHLGSCSAGTLRIAMRARGPLDAAIVTGDISEAPDLRRHLEQLKSALGCTVYYVLGNHDYYRGSYASVAQGLKRPLEGTTWLRTAPPVVLQEGVVLTGHDGWYDGRAGLAEETPVILNDFLAVADLKPHVLLRKVMRANGFLGYQIIDKTPLLQKLAEVADAWAEEAGKKIDEALALSPRQIIFATHIPPFPGACWHKGEVSNAYWQPWFVNYALGHVLAHKAEENPDVAFLVLCGHTHSPGTYRHSSNLVVVTGSSEYGDPRISAVLDLSHPGAFGEVLR